MGGVERFAMANPAVKYPWFELVSGEDLEQGDILESCPVFLPPDDLAEGPLEQARFRFEERDVIVMSQTCDLVKGRRKLTEVLLCAVWLKSQLKTGHVSTDAGMEDARRGNLPAFHVLNECLLPESEREFRVVDFRRVHALPISFVRKRAERTPHLRLLPPYREHLSQAFARYFMRVGLPSDVPPFKE